MKRHGGGGGQTQKAHLIKTKISKKENIKVIKSQEKNSTRDVLKE